ncbi:protein kintoun isoform X2 [Sinocyclocheilus grahami]|uniref:protein kintoun isoform X2 n=1 Tax=Sinocyclocheilus grahami TaxID=75366 RepID=UPI0007AD1131|nr:PREDICTED: protein kintoun isoform X2 [Sinocyclocheilus grahami]
MDFSKLEEMNLTRDELNRFGEALKDEKFRELLNEYAAEISNPENRRRYEEEITQLEKDRGTSVQFIHPEAHHVLKTRGARDKLFINICSDQLIDKPSCEAATGRDGEAGYNWRLPFSLTPGRPDRDAAGRSCVVYDVIFHPDALQAAEHSARLLELLHSTAVRGVQDAFHVPLDSSSVKQLKMKYKGVPQAAVIRRPIPGEPQQGSSDPEPEPGASCAAPPDPGDSRSSSSNQPTKPHYTVKYRSVVDLQDYRCSRDSGPGARPREIIITVDLPLLGSAQDAEVSVQERRLVLDSQKPAYKLDLPLSYPVDEDKGDAKFNKTKKQLTITLPVQPARSTALHQIRCDEMKSSGEDEDDAADQVPETSACDTAGLQHEPETGFPFASEPQIIDLTTEPQTQVNPAVNRTEPQEPDHSHLIYSVEMNNEVDSSSNTFSSEAEIQTRTTANGRDEDIHEVSGALETEHTQALESDTASDANASVPHQPLTTDNNALINQQLNHEEDRSSSQDTEPKTRRSSEDHESTTERSEEPAAADGVIPRESEPDGRHGFIGTHKTSAALCFQNSLWSDLDLS